MVKPNNMFNGHDSVVPPSGPQMQNFMRMPQQFDFGDQMPSSENAKKAKIDANDSHFLDGNTANPSTGIQTAVLCDMPVLIIFFVKTCRICGK